MPDTGALIAADLAVAEGALRRGDLVVTADHGDIQSIVDSVKRELVIEPV